MKTILTILLLGTLALGCSPDVDPPNEWFEIEIKELEDVSCKLPVIIFRSHQQQAYEIIGNNSGTYNALNLPAGTYTVGTRLTVKIEKPIAPAPVICDAIGPHYPQVFIAEIQ